MTCRGLPSIAGCVVLAFASAGACGKGSPPPSPAEAANAPETANEPVATSPEPGVDRFGALKEGGAHLGYRLPRDASETNATGNVRSFRLAAPIAAVSDFFATRGYAVEALPNGVRVSQTQTSATATSTPPGTAVLYVTPGPDQAWRLVILKRPIGARREEPPIPAAGSVDTSKVRPRTPSLPHLKLLDRMRTETTAEAIYGARARPAARQGEPAH